MRQSLLVVLLLLVAFSGFGQEHSLSLGLYSGVSIPYTRDAGIALDSRYRERYNIKLSAIGFSYGMDFSGHGFVISPGLVNVGQNFLVVNNVGGEVGLRKIDMQYFCIPIALKFHIIDLSFFKVSAVLNAAPAFLTRGSEQISHQSSRLLFPPEVYAALTPDYTIVYDGVLTPVVSDRTLAIKSDFKTIQLFVGAGFRSDWDVSPDWRVAFDVRLNYGVLDPRAQPRIDNINNFQSIYEKPGERNDFYAQFTIGIMRYVTWEKSDKEKVKKRKSTKRYKPDLRGIPKPRNTKPKG